MLDYWLYEIKILFDYIDTDILLLKCSKMIYFGWSRVRWWLRINQIEHSKLMWTVWYIHLSFLKMVRIIYISLESVVENLRHSKYQLDIVFLVLYSIIWLCHYKSKYTWLNCFIGIVNGCIMYTLYYCVSCNWLWLCCETITMWIIMLNIFPSVWKLICFGAELKYHWLVIKLLKNVNQF